MTWYIMFFIAGWFSAVVGYEVGAEYGLLAAGLLIWLLMTIKIWRAG